jgi:Tol biopolymer transport system component
VIAKSGHGAAYIERRDREFRVVHEGKAGRSYKLVGDLTISEDGSRVAYVAHIDDVRKSIIADERKGPSFKDIGMPHFTPDGNHLVYTVTKEREDRLVIDHKVHEDLWASQEVAISPDSRFLAFAAMPPGGGRIDFVITDFALEDRKVFEFCGESFVVSDDRSRIAVVCSEAGARSIKIIDFQGRSVVETLTTLPAGAIVRKRFSADNRSFVYTTMTDDYQRFLHYKGRAEKVPKKDDEIMSDPLVLTDPERVGFVIGNAFKVRFTTAFHKNKKTEKAYGYISDFIASPDGRHHAYIAIDAGGEERMRIVADGNEGPLFDKIVSPLFSPDNRFLVYRARQDGRRFLVVSDLKGRTVSQHKVYDMVFQPVFVAGGGAVAYGVLDGNELWWKVEKL